MPDIQPPAVENPSMAQVNRGQHIIPTGLNSIGTGAKSFGGLSIAAYGALAALLVMVLGIALMFILNMNMHRELNNVTSKNNNLQSLLNSSKYKEAESELANLELEVERLKKILLSQRDFETMFKVIGDNTYKKVKYNSFAFTKDGKVNVVGETSSYSDLGKFLKTFGNAKNILNFVIGTYSSSSGDAAKVNFSFSFEYPHVSKKTFTNKDTNTSSTNSSTIGNEESADQTGSSSEGAQ